MGNLEGLKEYLNEYYEVSVFDKALESGNPWVLHLHGGRSAKARVLENRKWDMTLDMDGKKEEMQKIQVKFLYPADQDAAVSPLIKTGNKVKAQGLEPILAPGKRYFVKNKSLFPLMVEKEVLFFTLIRDVIRQSRMTYFPAAIRPAQMPVPLRVFPPRRFVAFTSRRRRKLKAEPFLVLSSSSCPFRPSECLKLQARCADIPCMEPPQSTRGIITP
ncbi:MAG: hypothetical protein JW821_06020 [Deltaproteobacteria bacterium]|nr:hypothetical protein [Deltaproteobacteria bacterium]